MQPPIERVRLRILMLLHVIWAFAEVGQNCPTFSITGVILQCSDGSPAYVSQSRFRWQGDGWEADVEISKVGTAGPSISGTLRMSDAVWHTWTRKSLNPRSEATRQLRDLMQAREWNAGLGVVALHA